MIVIIMIMIIILVIKIEHDIYGDKTNVLCCKPINFKDDPQ